MQWTCIYIVVIELMSGLKQMCTRCRSVASFYRSSLQCDVVEWLCVCGFIIIRYHSQIYCCSIPRWYSMDQIPYICYSIDSMRPNIVQMWLTRDVPSATIQATCFKIFVQSLFKSMFNLVVSLNSTESLISGNVLHSMCHSNKWTIML